MPRDGTPISARWGSSPPPVSASARSSAAGCWRSPALPLPPPGRARSSPSPSTAHRDAHGAVVRRTRLPFPGVRRHLHLRAQGLDGRGRLRGRLGGVVRLGGGRGAVRPRLRGVSGARPRAGDPGGRRHPAGMARRPFCDALVRARSGCLLHLEADAVERRRRADGDRRQGHHLRDRHRRRLLGASGPPTRARRAQRTIPPLHGARRPGTGPGHGLHLHRAPGLRSHRRGRVAR